MIKLVLSDVDGTLIPLGEPHASRRTVEAIDALAGTDVRFGLATGRDVFELARLFAGSDSAYRTGILSNGKRIVVDGEVVRLTLIDNDALQRISEFLGEYDDTFATAYPAESDASNTVYCMGTKKEELVPWGERFSFTGVPVPRVPDVRVIGATIACAQDQSVLDEIKRRAAGLFPEFDFVQPAPHWCDIVPKGLNKGTALPWLLEELGVGRDEVMVMGDADNDVTILSAVEHAVVVANGTPAARAAARWHIGPCEEGAAAELLEALAAGNGSLTALEGVLSGA